MTPFNDVRRVTTDTLPNSYGPDRDKPLVATLHRDGQGDWLLLRPQGTRRTVRLRILDLYRQGLFYASAQVAAKARQLRKEGHSLASARRQAFAAVFLTPPRQPSRKGHSSQAECQCYRCTGRTPKRR